jgi:hypothetical protein
LSTAGARRDQAQRRNSNRTARRQLTRKWPSPNPERKYDKRDQAFTVFAVNRTVISAQTTTDASVPRNYSRDGFLGAGTASLAALPLLVDDID